MSTFKKLGKADNKFLKNIEKPDPEVKTNVR